MMKEGIGLKDQFIHGKHRSRDPDECHLRHTEGGRHCDFSEMEAKAGRDIQIRIGVMHVMKSPKERNTMIGHMPPIKSQIHQQESQNKFNYRRNSCQVNKSKWFLRAP